MSAHQNLPQPPRRAKAIAIPYPRTDERVVSWIHLLLALLIPFLVLALTSCAPDNGKPVDYGPEIAADKVTGALNDLIKGSDPSLTKLGAFGHFSTYQVLAENYLMVSSDTGHTVIARTLVSPYVAYDIREIQFNYHQGSEPEKLTRDFQLTFVDSATSANAESILKSITASRASNTTPIAVEPSGDTKKPTYHRLRTWESREPAPLAVQAVPGCLGLTDCQMTFRHLGFDLVYWEDPKGDRLHIELVTSPDVPQTLSYNMSRINDYIPGLVKSCLTQMVPVGDSGSKTLLTECQELVNFRLESDPASAESLMSSAK